MARVVVLVALAAVLAACGSRRISLLRKNALTYAQYHSLERGMTSDAVLKAFGEPANTLEREGRIRGLTYYCENATGKIQELRMVFDDGGGLDRWALSGTAQGADKATRAEDDEASEPDTD